MHSRSFADPIWKAATKQFIPEAKQAGTVKDLSFCLRCHVPGAFVLESLTQGQVDPQEILKLSSAGVFCDFCHSVQGLRQAIKPYFFTTKNIDLNTDPHTKLGPLTAEESANKAHKTAYSKLHTTSEFCAPCHDIYHFENQLPIATTYTEWKQSPYNTGDPKTTITCQDCHMRQRPGVPATGSTDRPDNPGKAAATGPKRSHVPTHYFVGSNTMITNAKHAKMAEERLQHAATVTILTPPHLQKGTLNKVTVKVTNSGSGHKLPTGMSGFRQMWIEFIITDPQQPETRLFSSGILDSHNNLPQDTHIFHTILGNKKGNPVDNFALADRVLYDNRIPPKGYKTADYSFLLPHSFAGNQVVITATLKYRIISQKLLNHLLKDAAEHVPFTTMEMVTKPITVQ